MTTVIEQRPELTFRYNLKQGRHAWLRLTPAYSVKMVQQILERCRAVRYVLDPFAGTGTTGLVCQEYGILCDLIDINPFLVWLAKVKTASYTQQSLEKALEGAYNICRHASDCPPDNLWFPPISNIHRWWSEKKLILLAKIHREIHRQFPHPSPAKDLISVAFCHLIISWSNTAFNHQSLSFKKRNVQGSLFNDESQILQHFIETTRRIVAAASRPVNGPVSVWQADSRHIPSSAGKAYDCVITSPPYPNRISYIRELRPYMFWLGHLTEARQAGELDWQAIGGTWGIATSRLKTWTPPRKFDEYPEFEVILSSISNHNPLLANYVHKYFVDIATHLDSLYPLLTDGANVFYVVGNSKFYNTLIPVEAIYAHLLKKRGFRKVAVEVLRKRNSKKELYEFLVSAKK